MKYIMTKIKKVVNVLKSLEEICLINLQLKCLMEKEKSYLIFTEIGRYTTTFKVLQLNPKMK